MLLYDTQRQRIALYGARTCLFVLIFCRVEGQKAATNLTARRETVRFETMGIEEEADRTLFVRNLDSRVTEELLFELFLQVTLFC